ncbi:hypothetical protein HGM15179_013043 [Zosterops borbonicus]|uniref:Uncharacterized protein n=1 Tax=Zosterops borbonicus TaxID=364589 RepID=A0A8K1LHE0_9PASS|nr:hypothetical protein HGM15179_013043 [Zosterops borbonicus]
MLFNILISDLNDEIKDTLMKFGADAKLRGEMDTLEGSGTLLNRLKEQVNKNLMKDKCNILYLGKQSRTVSQIGVYPDPGLVLVDKQLEKRRLREDFITMSQYLYGSYKEDGDSLLRGSWGKDEG